MHGKGRFSEYLQCHIMRDAIIDGQVTLPSGFAFIASIFQRSPILFTLASFETGEYTFVNDAFVEKTGFSREQVLGRTTKEIGLLDQIDTQNIHREIMRKGSFVKQELSFRTVDGKQLACSYFCKHTEFDGCQQILTLAQDIQEECFAKCGLSQQAANLEIIFNHVPNILALVNEEGKVERINKQAEKFIGKKNDDILGFLGGEVFNCLNSFNGAGCGRNTECNDCPVRTSVMRTLQTGLPIEEKPEIGRAHV
jgi:PAS domain S-box-containing protein